MRAVCVGLLAIVLATSPAGAFGLDDVISDFLYYREALRADGGRPQPTGTLFLDATYDVTGVRRELESNRIQSYGGEVGALVRLHDVFLGHLSFRGLGFDVKEQFADGEFRVSGRQLETRLGGSLIYLDTTSLKAWLTVEGTFINTDTPETDSTWFWRAGPSTTLSWRLGDVLLEPGVGVTFFDAFNADTERTTVLHAGFAAKYRGDRWRPQLNFVYSKRIDPDINKTEGTIEVGPELTYALTPAILLGIGYTYSTPVDRENRLESHTATLSLRWTF